MFAQGPNQANIVSQAKIIDYIVIHQCSVVTGDWTIYFKYLQSAVTTQLLFRWVMAHVLGRNTSQLWPLIIIILTGLIVQTCAAGYE